MDDPDLAPHTAALQASRTRQSRSRPLRLLSQHSHVRNSFIPPCRVFEGDIPPVGETGESICDPWGPVRGESPPASLLWYQDAFRKRRLEACQSRYKSIEYPRPRLPGLRSLFSALTHWHEHARPPSPRSEVGDARSVARLQRLTACAMPFGMHTHTHIPSNDQSVPCHRAGRDCADTVTTIHAQRPRARSLGPAADAGEPAAAPGDAIHGRRDVHEGRARPPV